MSKSREKKVVQERNQYKTWLSVNGNKTNE